MSESHDPVAQWSATRSMVAFELWTAARTSSGPVGKITKAALDSRRGRSATSTILKAALREAAAQDLLATNPADKAKPPAAREAKAPVSTFDWPATTH